MSPHLKLPVGALLLTFLVSSGCNSEPKPEFSPIEGVVRINGKPERGVSVRLTPDQEKGNGFPAFATGTTDEQGKFTLKYEFRDQEGLGAPVGWNRVMLFDTKVGYTPQGQLPKPSAIPNIYSSPSSTPLLVEVKTGENPLMELNVKR